MRKGIQYFGDFGLCATCAHSPTCLYLKQATRPITQCEEFRVFSPQQQGDEKAEAPSVPESSGDKGLCVNCENRDTCTLPRPEGGVWHCEEYK